MTAERDRGWPLAKKKPKPLSEAQIQRQIMDMLQVHPQIGHVWRQNTQGVPIHGRPGKYRPAPCKGVSDILGCLKNGRIIAIEVKSEKGKLSPDQRKFLNSIEQSGGLALVARSVEYVKIALQEAQA